MFKHKIKKEFIAQLIVNCTSRLAYLALLGYIASTAAANSPGHIEYLTLSLAASSILSFQVSPFALSVQSDTAKQFAAACNYQFWLTLCLALLGIFLEEFLSLWRSGDKDYYLAVILTAAMLSINEITFAVNTLRERPSRAIIYYGFQSIFYIGYLSLMALTMMSQHQICSTVSFFGLVLITTYFLSISKGLPVDRASFFMSIKQRAKLLACIFPAIILQPLIVLLLAKSEGPNLPASGVNFLMLLSVGGAVAFVYSNYFQFYGRALLDEEMSSINKYTLSKRAYYNWLLLLGCGVLSIPAMLLYKFYKNHSIDSLAFIELLATLFYAASVIRSQYFAAIFTRLNIIHYIFNANILFVAISALWVWLSPARIEWALLSASVAKLIFQEGALFKIITKIDNH